ncbi:hypothetical protein ACE6H2_021072 [Prunus campanulata]
MPMAKKKKLEKESNNHLPQDIIVHILSRLPVKSLIRFSCVSKRWRSIVTDPEFAKSQFKVASEQQTLRPRLLVSTASHLQSLNLEETSSFDDNSAVRELSCPFKKSGSHLVLLGSCNGLVCVALDFHESYYIWNPSTGFFLKLPNPGFASKGVRNVYNYGFGYVAATDDYKVVAAARLIDPTDGDPVKVFSLKANSWERIAAPKLSNWSNGVLSNEALHWQHCLFEPFRQAILAFDLAKDEFREVALPILNEDNVKFGQLGVLLEGCLCVTTHRKTDPHCLMSNRNPELHHIEVWVMREYNVLESWTKLFKLKVSGHPEQMWPSRPIFFRESGAVVMQSCNMEAELTWFDEKEDKFCNPINGKAKVCDHIEKEDEFEKDVVCSELYRLEGSPLVHNVIEYVESLLPFFSNINVADEQTPPVEIPIQHLIIVQQISVENISSMVPMKLTHTNFTQWKWLFLPVLKKYSVQGLVDGTEICPPAFLVDKNGKISNHVNPAFEKWMDRDQSVMVWLKSRISEDLLPYSVGASSSRALWMALEKLVVDASHSHFG